MIRLGIDIGGTFTDFVMAGDGVSGLAVHKRLTTPDDPSRAVLEGAEALLARHGLGMREVAEIVHGTTLVTNAVIERRGAVTGMLVTRGFIDALEMGLEQRYDLFDLRLRFAPPVVGRRCRAEIDERVAHDGTVVTAIDLAATTDAIAALIDAHGIEALAVCFLNAYVNPVHEQAVRDLAARAFPSLHVTTSADVAPQIREFERWTTATVNAYCQPRFDRYLAALEDGLAARGFAGRFLMMSSSGGAVTPQTARRYPVRMLESGPAAGVLMSAEHGRRLGIADLLAFDLGGTTAKGAIVRDGRPVRRYAMEVARVHGHKRGSGLSLRLPVVDMTEIGSGGGSVAHVDERLLLRVGPRSTGAMPGPACYGRGGTLATLTDANLMLGYLDPGFFLGGAMALDRSRARAAIADAIGGPLRLGDDRRLRRRRSHPCDGSRAQARRAARRAAGRCRGHVGAGPARKPARLRGRPQPRRAAGRAGRRAIRAADGRGRRRGGRVPDRCRPRRLRHGRRPPRRSAPSWPGSRAGNRVAAGRGRRR
jgi:N-methylhydantoinase A